MAKDISVEVVATKIILVRGRKVMLDKDLAQLYGVKTNRLKEQVRRNLRRFPDDFMFQLTKEEVEASRSHFAALNDHSGGQRLTLSKRGMNVKYLPYVFSEQGVAMLSSVLSSERAVQVNIAIMRAFVKLREVLLTNKELAEKIEELGRRVGEHDEKITEIFEVIKQLLMSPPVTPKPQIGFHK